MKSRVVLVVRQEVEGIRETRCEGLDIQDIVVKRVNRLIRTIAEGMGSATESIAEKLTGDLSQTFDDGNEYS